MRSQRFLATINSTVIDWCVAAFGLFALSIHVNMQAYKHLRGFLTPHGFNPHPTGSSPGLRRPSTALPASFWMAATLETKQHVRQWSSLCLLALLVSTRCVGGMGGLGCDVSSVSMQECCWGSIQREALYLTFVTFCLYTIGIQDLLRGGAPPQLHHTQGM